MAHHRGQESPMDFRYDNGTGPMDARSPFAQVGTSQMNAHQFRNNNNNNNNNNHQSTNDKKRSFARAESPTKPPLPSLRAPASSQSYLFSNGSKPLPAVPNNFAAKFSTPRNLNTSYDFESSGGETPKSPEHRDLDSDATPDTMGLRSRFANLDSVSKPEFKAGGRSSPVKEQKELQHHQREPKERRQSIWGDMVDAVKSKMSPGGRSRDTDKYSHAVERRVAKNRNKQVERSRTITISDDDSAGDDTPDKRAYRSTRKVSGHKQQRHKEAVGGNQQPGVDAKDKPHWMYTFFQFLTNHPTLPHILSFYAQLMLNLFLIGGIMYILYSFWSTIKSDVDKKSSEAIAELLSEMAVCAQQYTANRCERSTRVPAMEVVCTNWEKCMNQDPRNVGRARVSAHTFAEIFNGFIEPISYKAMFFTVILIFGSIGISNFAFSIFRDKAAAAHAASQQHHHYYANNQLPPPPTPQRQISGQEGGFWTPYHQQQGLEPAQSGFAGRQIEDVPQKSPTRKIQFR